MCYPPINHGMTVLHTNRNNVTIFNNGTYHINFTLPTQLNSEKVIANWPEFVFKHKQMARLFQWISPLLIAKYGSGDCFRLMAANEEDGRKQFPDGSQRLCVSRYVSVCTYDTETMKTGKILLIDTPDLPWIKEIYDKPECAYIKLSKCGCDINFHKHHNHGLEFRIFDWFSERYLPFVMSLFVHLGDEAMSYEFLPFQTNVPEVANPMFDATYNHLLARVIWDGDVVLTEEERGLLLSVFKIDKPIEEKESTCGSLLQFIYKSLREKWIETGQCSKFMRPQ